MSADNEIAVCQYTDGKVGVCMIQGCPDLSQTEEVAEKIAKDPATEVFDDINKAFWRANQMWDEAVIVEYGITSWKSTRTFAELKGDQPK